MGFRRLAVCVAKTQYSLTDDPKHGGPRRMDVEYHRRFPLGRRRLCGRDRRQYDADARAAAGTRALAIDVDEDGNIVGV